MKTEHKITISVVLLALGIIVGLGWLSDSQATKEKERLGQPLLGEEIIEENRNHVSTGTLVNYKSNPPAGGPHYVNSQRAGIYDQPVPDGNLIHSLEHGAVILWYKSDLPQGNIDQLKKIYNSVAISKKIMVPRESLDAPVVLTSWGRLLKLETINETEIKAFMTTNNNRAPEKAPL